MGNIAVFASGNGSNFQAFIDVFENTEHRISVLVCDRQNAYARTRAAEASIPIEDLRYGKNTNRQELEQELLRRLEAYKPDLIVLAGFMRLISPILIDAYPEKIINIHPSLLPKYPGTHGIEESYASGDTEIGVTIHRVDYGLDTGPIIQQGKIPRIEGESLEAFEQRIHALEHRLYPEVILSILEGHSTPANT